MGEWLQAPFREKRTTRGPFRACQGSRVLSGFGWPAPFEPVPARSASTWLGFGVGPAGLGVRPLTGMVSSYSSARFAVPIQPPGQVARERAAEE